MNKFISSTFNNTVVELDGNHFEKCVFENCEIVYKGLQPFNLINCNFIACKWKLEGAASNTINFLKVMYKDMGEFGKKMVEATFENIKKIVSSIYFQFMRYSPAIAGLFYAHRSRTSKKVFQR